ncbi:MAG: TIGR00269 family protein [Methanotrichaceae archaeon]|nr:TIGR00269 family protein [Methanotrichaceae archaeon]
MKCSKCDYAAILFQRYSTNHFCAEHFIEQFEQKVTEELFKGQMAKDEDRIAVALSGGKDSVVVLYILYKILADTEIDLFAITVDEGIRGYRDDTMKSARKIVDDLGIEHEILSFRHEYGFDLDTLVQDGAMPCTVCGVFRKNALNRAAKRLGANKVATGHNLDDEVQSIMMNYLKGDIERLMRLRPMKTQPGLVPRIKPLREIPEKEVALYGIVKGFYEEAKDCPYASLSLRSDVRDMMNRFENLFPGTKHSTLKGYEKVIELTGDKRQQTNLSFCKTCGEPCAQDLCKACVLLDKLNSR